MTQEGWELQLAERTKTCADHRQPEDGQISGALSALLATFPCTVCSEDLLSHPPHRDHYAGRELEGAEDAPVTSPLSLLGASVGEWEVQLSQKAYDSITTTSNVSLSVNCKAPG